MSTAPGAVAKAFLDAMPTLDYNKLVTEARRQVGIVLVGDPSVNDAILALLRGDVEVAPDARLALWRFEKDKPSPIPSGKAELVIVAPCSEENMREARGAFAGVATLPVRIGGEVDDATVTASLLLPDSDTRTMQKVLLPAIVDRLWERRLSLGRGLPGTRDIIARRLTRAAAKDVKVLLGSVAGAGSGRNGAPTAATAQLLMHQAALIVSIAAIYGAPLDDKRNVFTRVAPNLAPTLLLDGAEAGISRLAANAGKGTKYGKLAGPLAAYVTRPTLSASSTLIAGATARRVFRQDRQPSTILGRSREAGRRAAISVGQGMAMIGGLVGSRFRARNETPADAPVSTDGPSVEIHVSAPAPEPESSSDA
jgi:hypothetical protein